MAKTAKKVPVYLRASDVKMLERRVQHTDPSGWVRGLVRAALDKMAEKEEEERGGVGYPDP
jgi:hypothetical protein